MSSSIIVCVHNRGAQVQACLDSLLAMDVDDFELVLVDDGSSDDTWERLQTFRSSHPDRVITLVQNPRNLGTAGARNVGMETAAGDLIFYTDSDCTVSRGWLSALRKCFDDPQVAAATGPILSPPPTNWAERAYCGTARMRITKWHVRHIGGGSMGFRKEIALRLRFDEALTHYCDEDELGWRLNEEGYLIAFAPEAEVVHHHPVALHSYLRMGYKQGQGSARLWHKQGKLVGRDLWAGLLGIVTLPLGYFGARWFVLPLALFLLQLTAIAFNERVLKGKGWRETVLVLPVCTAFYVCKLLGVITIWWHLVTRTEPVLRQSRRAWVARRKNRTA